MPVVVDVVIVGAGCTGTSAAWQLARRGAGRVLLLEKQALAAGGTGRSTAIIRTHYTHEALARMALAARRVFENFGEVVGGNCGFRRTGFLALNRARDREAVEANVVMHRSLGIDAHVLTPTDLQQLEPRLSTEEVGVAAWEPESGQADPHGTTTAFAEAARRAGAEVRIGPAALSLLTSGTRVVGVRTSEGEIAAGTVVVAAGYRSKDLLAATGFDLPLTPVRHSIAILHRSTGFGPSHPVISDRVWGRYFMPESDELTLAGTTGPHEGRVDPEVEADYRPGDEELERLASGFLRRFKDEDAARLKGGWTGVYDCSPDLQPVLGPVPGIEGLHVAAGFSGHGFKLSPVVGELLAQRILDGRTALVDLALFRPSRFAENDPIVSPHPYSAPTLG